jgi:DNA repair protein RadA/Sms
VLSAFLVTVSTIFVTNLPALPVPVTARAAPSVNAPAKKLTELSIEGDKIKSYRFLKSIKNRFGSTDEVGIFRMDTAGLVEVPDPAAEFIEEREEMVIGSALGCTMEGNRPLVVEVQALTSASAFGYPKRSATGFDQNRLLMIIAVLQKYFGIDLSSQDVFVNVSGGFKIRETACDLAVMKAIMSSYSKKPLKHNVVYIGEAGLTGKIRNVAYQELREQEMKRLGFDITNKIG